MLFKRSLNGVRRNGARRFEGFGIDSECSWGRFWAVLTSKSIQVERIKTHMKSYIVVPRIVVPRQAPFNGLVGLLRPLCCGHACPQYSGYHHGLPSAASPPLRKFPLTSACSATSLHAPLPSRLGGILQDVPKDPQTKTHIY